MDDNLIQKTLRILRTDSIDETLLDELQSKVCYLKLFGFFLS